MNTRNNQIKSNKFKEVFNVSGKKGKKVKYNTHAREMKIMNDFKDKEIEVENYFMTDISDIISEFSDQKGQEKYNLMKALIKELKETLTNMNDLESYELHMDEYVERFTKLNKEQTTTEKYFDIHGEFTVELILSLKEFVRPKTQELHKIITFSEMHRYDKTTNNLKLQYKKFLDRVGYIIDESIGNTCEMYKSAINKIIEPLQELIDVKVEIYNELVKPKNIEEIHKQKFKKILDCDAMNDLLFENGYSAIRQNGSHLIYSDGVKSIPVPQHSSLNKGLGYEIQKQIKNSEEKIENMKKNKY
jgi:predicted RNA binding protein YcfA (HicA-like mRNA interferase family)